MDARALLDIAADYVAARDGNQLAQSVGSAGVNLDEIAARFDTALREYVRSP